MVVKLDGLGVSRTGPRIAHIITGLETGGAERALLNILGGGLNEKFNNFVVSLGGVGTVGPKIKSLGVPVYSLGMRRGMPSSKVLRKLYQIAHSVKPHIVQGWMYHGNLAASLVRMISPGSPALAWNIRHSLYHLADEKPMTRHVIRANRFFSSRPELLLYNSQLSRHQHETFGFSSLFGNVIPNGVDINKFSFSADFKNKVRIDLKIPKKSFLVGHVARLHPMKDHSLFLHAAVDIALRHPNVHFILCGRGVTFAEQSLSVLIPEGIKQQFHLLGERDDIPALMSAMDIFCQSSWTEAFPNVLGEAMACDTPCVATDVGDSALIVGDAGVVVPARNVGALTQGIENLLVMPECERRVLAELSRQRICENYTLGAIVEKYTAAYEQLAYPNQMAV